MVGPKEWVFVEKHLVILTYVATAVLATAA